VAFESGKLGGDGAASYWAHPVIRRGAGRGEEFNEAFAVCFRGLGVFRVTGDHTHHPLPDPDRRSVIDTTVMRRAQLKSAAFGKTAGARAWLGPTVPVSGKTAAAIALI
jgi:hypothetical protein